MTYSHKIHNFSKENRFDTSISIKTDAFFNMNFSNKNPPSFHYKIKIEMTNIIYKSYTISTISCIFIKTANRNHYLKFNYDI